jgi:uncharacterized protein YqiB (DUF1249 family)
MKIQKVPSIDLLYNWFQLPFENSSDFNKIEIYTASTNKEECIKGFLNLFDFDLKNIVVGPSMIGILWEDFASVYKDDLIEYNNVYEENFVKMLKDNNISQHYFGYFRIFDWEYFLNLQFDVIENVNGTDSLKFYNTQGKYAFYPHPPNSYGLYYEKLSLEVQHIINYSKKLGWNLKYYPLNDDYPLP